jgi:hypothetical protein
MYLNKYWMDKKYLLQKFVPTNELKVMFKLFSIKQL